jgi:hypothetical protein
MWNGLPGGLDRLWRVADAIEKLVPTSPRHKWRFGSFSSLLLLFTSLEGHWLKGVFLFLRKRSFIRRKRRTLRVSLLEMKTRDQLLLLTFLKILKHEIWQNTSLAPFMA